MFAGDVLFVLGDAIAQVGLEGRSVFSDESRTKRYDVGESTHLLIYNLTMCAACEDCSSEQYCCNAQPDECQTVR